MIPKTIHICYKNIDILTKYALKWKTLNPNYELQLYDDALCEKFLLDNFSSLHRDIFVFIKDGPIKADFFRVCVLYAKGGIYVDADIEPFVPIDEYIDPNVWLATCFSNPKTYYGYGVYYNPHIIVANKSNPILKLCIDTYIDLYKSSNPYSYWGWSIVYIFASALSSYGIKKLSSNNNVFNGLLIQMLEEGVPAERQYCYFNNKLVIANRYIDYVNHQFVN